MLRRDVERDILDWKWSGSVPGVMIVDNLLFFSISSLTGWLLESVYASIRFRRRVNRGFLPGPFILTYGLGSIFFLGVPLRLSLQISEWSPAVMLLPFLLPAIRVLFRLTIERVYALRIGNLPRSGTLPSRIRSFLLSTLLCIAWAYFVQWVYPYYRLGFERIPGMLLYTAAAILCVYLTRNVYFAFQHIRRLDIILYELENFGAILKKDFLVKQALYNRHVLNYNEKQQFVRNEWRQKVEFSRGLMQKNKAGGYGLHQYQMEKANEELLQALYALKEELLANTNDRDDAYQAYRDKMRAGVRYALSRIEGSKEFHNVCRLILAFPDMSPAQSRIYHDETTKSTNEETVLVIWQEVKATALSVPKTKKPHIKGGEMMKYLCTVCGHVYDPAEGDPENSFAPGTAFDALPEGWVCPVCGVGKDSFEIQE